MTELHTTIARQPVDLDSSEIVRRLRNVAPEPLEDHYVVINGRRFPPKQVISVLTGLDRADFNTHRARQVLRELGFTVGRRSTPAEPQSSWQPATPERSAEADALRPFIGQWVAQRGAEVLVAAATPQAVIAWLERHNKQADAMFRVPRDEREASGIAPA